MPETHSSANQIDFNHAKTQDQIAELMASALANAAPEIGEPGLFAFKSNIPQPNPTAISAHFCALFAPGFAAKFPDAQIEIAYAEPGANDLNSAGHFSIFNLETAANWAISQNNIGHNVYVLPAVLSSNTKGGGASDASAIASRYAWAEFEGSGEAERIDALLKQHGLEPELIITTGTVPHLRQHLYFRIKDGTTDMEKLRAANTALRDLLGTDDVQNVARPMRLAGTVSYPSDKKRAKGYVAELTMLRSNLAARSYTAEELIALSPIPGPKKPRDPFDFNNAPLQGETRRSADDLFELLQKSRIDHQWHNSVRSAIACMVGKGWSDEQIRLACAPYCDGGVNDPDLDPLIEGARRKFNKPEPTAANAAPKLILSSAEFLNGFVPPDYLIVGLLQRRFIYSFTGLTGSAKTAIALLWAAHVALGRSIGDYQVEQGSVLFLAGENPDDIRMRWKAMAEHHGFDADDIDVHFLPGVYKLTNIGARLWAEVDKIGPVSLVIVDTSAVYFEGDDENHNVQMIIHAHRLRDLVMLPGSPCVLVCCHPIKNATPDNMLPRGGGAFLNEMDGNLTSIRTDTVAMVHWCGKFRGPDFVPIPFGLTSTTAQGLVDSKGREIMTVVASPLSEEATQKAENAARTDENRVLVSLRKSSLAVVSLTELATWCGWRTKDGKPNKGRAQRAAERLKKAKLIEATRGGFSLTPKGRREAEKME